MKCEQCAEYDRNLTETQLREVRLVCLNAELIAAIHLLLTCMTDIAEEAGDCQEWNDGGYMREACNQARAAIAKARGD